MRKVVAGALMMGLGACAEFQTGGNIGGANMGQKAPGNVAGGIRLTNGDVAVAPTGRFFATKQKDRVVFGAVKGSEAKELSAMPDADRMAFFPGEDGAWLARKDGDGRVTLIAWRESDGATLWTAKVPANVEHQNRMWLDVAKGGETLIVAGRSVVVVDGHSGAIKGSYTPGDTIYDVDVTNNGQKILVTHADDSVNNSGHPRTTLTRVDTDQPEQGSDGCEVSTNNCAGETVLANGDSRAFLSPTLCHMDPVTAFDLSQDSCSVNKQMPGFGAVAMSPDGKTAVAFLDRNAFERGTSQEVMEVPPEVASSPLRFHLMFINVDTLSYSTTPVGNQMPRYAFTPNGENLLVDFVMDPLSQIRVLDVASKRFSEIKGLPTHLHQFSFSDDGRKVFVRDNTLLELDLGNRVVAPARVAFIPDSLNVTPDGETVLLANLPREAIHFLDATRGTETGRTSPNATTVAAR